MKIKKYSEFIKTKERQKKVDAELKKANFSPEATLLLLKFVDDIQKKNELL